MPVQTTEGRSVFVSGQIRDIHRVRELLRLLRSAGMRVTHDWTTSEELGDKLVNSAEAGRRAAADIAGIEACDDYVLLSGNSLPGKGMYVELGAALARRRLTGRPNIYVVGELSHPSIFYFHPDVVHVGTITDLIDAIHRTVG